MEINLETLLLCFFVFISHFIYKAYDDYVKRQQVNTFLNICNTIFNYANVLNQSMNSNINLQRSLKNFMKDFFNSPTKTKTTSTSNVYNENLDHPDESDTD